MKVLSMFIGWENWLSGINLKMSMSEAVNDGVNYQGRMEDTYHKNSGPSPKQRILRWPQGTQDISMSLKSSLTTLKSTCICPVVFKVTFTSGMFSKSISTFHKVPLKHYLTKIFDIDYIWSINSI